MKTVLLRTSPAPASAEVCEIAANDDVLAPTAAVVVRLALPAAPRSVAEATTRPDAANSPDDDYCLGGYAGI